MKDKNKKNKKKNRIRYVSASLKGLMPLKNRHQIMQTVQNQQSFKIL